ncbi:MAG: hypothetical protein JXQ30_11025 [Spirochaetes bacterium]|nr:hypothetical protein [Spirochaetota bacterium]
MIEKTEYRKTDAVRITNDKEDELVVLTGAGPRIISFRPEGGNNVFWVNEEDFRGPAGRDDPWRVFGGTRLWLSPETETSYRPDNGPCEVEIEDGSVTVFSAPDPVTKIRKGVTIAPHGEYFAVTYTIKNEGMHLITAGLWAITCVQPEEGAAIHLPWGGGGPWDVKEMKYWRRWLQSATDVTSVQWNPTNEFFIVNPTGEVGKVGFANSRGFAMYSAGDTTFIKYAAYVPTAHYPDGGCTFEVYTCERFYEIETLSPLFVLCPDESRSHCERWWAGKAEIDKKTIDGAYDFVNRVLFV